MAGRNGNSNVSSFDEKNIVIELHTLVRFCKDERIRRKLLDLADDILTDNLDTSYSYDLPSGYVPE